MVDCATAAGRCQMMPDTRQVPRARCHLVRRPERLPFHLLATIDRSPWGAVREAWHHGMTRQG
jgi:hypothetical protein